MKIEINESSIDGNFSTITNNVINAYNDLLSQLNSISIPSGFSAAGLISQAKSSININKNNTQDICNKVKEGLSSIRNEISSINSKINSVEIKKITVRNSLGVGSVKE